MQRRILAIAVHVVIGAAVTIGVAWVCWDDDSTYAYVKSAAVMRGVATPLTLLDPMRSANTCIVTTARLRTRVLIGSSAVGPRYVPLPSKFSDKLFTTAIPGHTPEAVVPFGMREIALPWLHGAPWPMEGTVEHRFVIASGWPLSALGVWSDTQFFNRPTGVVQGPNRVTGAWLFRGTELSKDPTVLPVRPFALGFIVNTLVFGSASWLLAAGSSALREVCRSRASRRGRCPRCDYDRSGTPAASVCPECGEAGVGTGETRGVDAAV